MKKEDDIALGNLIGSNIFNIAIVLGIPALLSPGALNPQVFQRDYWVMLAASVLLTALCLSKKTPYRTGRWRIIMLRVYRLPYGVVLFFIITLFRF
ncbi:hypothetical protein [Pectobacterium parmentieri]|uniref:hypothetical protein n=1 Tax=Pectobacterium parmentieri TaxID=1905730 RepID=UPI0023E33D1E|nr:hypothetical protein [Pectobacterium parmentieri]